MEIGNPKRRVHRIPVEDPIPQRARPSQPAQPARAPAPSRKPVKSPDEAPVKVPSR